MSTRSIRLKEPVGTIREDDERRVGGGLFFVLHPTIVSDIAYGVMTLVAMLAPPHTLLRLHNRITPPILS